MFVRATASTLTLLLLLITAPALQAAESSTYDACRDLIMDYAYYRDHKNPDAYAALFTEDAELSILGDVRKGRDAIRQRLAEVTGNTVHLMSTIRITQVSETEATGVSYVTVYAMPPGEDPHTVDGWAGIGEYHDTYHKTAEGWKIAKRSLAMRLRDSGFKPPSQ